MDPKMNKEGLELDIQIEELEAKIAPDGETVSYYGIRFSEEPAT